jgi:hypothetical protein
MSVKPRSGDRKMSPLRRFTASTILLSVGLHPRPSDSATVRLKSNPNDELADDIEKAGRCA